MDDQTKETEEAKRSKPSKYKPELCAEAEQMAMLGLPDKDIGLLLGVCADTMTDWKESHPDFSEAILRGRASGHKSVTKAMFDRACGYEYEEEVVSINKKTGEIYKETVTKRLPPDPTCIQYYLSNRHKDSWKSIQRIEASVENIPAIRFRPAKGDKTEGETKKEDGRT